MTKIEEDNRTLKVAISEPVEKKKHKVDRGLSGWIILIRVFCKRRVTS